jgi:hypothetical protein
MHSRDYVNGSSGSFCHIGPECQYLSNDLIEKQTISFKIRNLKL